jgi:hypothetical protein
MAIPTNTTAATAITISSLPATIAQTVDDGGTTYTVWYRYTASTADALIGVYAPAASPYLPRLAVFLDPAGAAYLDLSNAAKPVQFPGTPGVTYYFSITPNSGNPSPAALTLSVESLSNQTVPIGSLLVNDDTAGFPGILLSVAANNAVLGTWPALAVGEGMGILADGTIAASLDDASDTEALTLYRADRSVIATVPWFATSTDQSQTVVTARETAFYVVNTNAALDSVIAQRVTPDGAVTHTWTIAIGSNTFLNGASVSPDQATLYYVVDSDGADGSLVYSYNLTTSTPIGTAIAAQSGLTPLRLICLTDGFLVVLYLGTPPPRVRARLFTSGGVFVRDFDAAGTSASDPRIATSALDPAAFWVWTKNTDNVTDVFEQFQVSDASVLTTVTGTMYESGVFRGMSPGATPVRFGHSESCDFVELRTAMPVPPSGNLPWPLVPPFIVNGSPVAGLTSIPIRRVRRGPHIVDEQKMIFLDTLQPDLQPGIGAVTGQGLTATVMLRMSKDGGHTWGGWRTTSAGALGRYLTRIRFVRFGQARDWVPEIAVSDPVVPWVVLQLLWQGTEGTS